MNTDLLGLISHEELSLPMAADHEGQAVGNLDLLNESPSTDDPSVRVKAAVGDVTVTPQSTDSQLPNVSDCDQLKSNTSCTDTDLEQPSFDDTKETDIELQFVYDTQQESTGEAVLLLPFDENNTSSTDEIEPKYTDSEGTDAGKNNLTVCTPLESVHADENRDKESLLLLDSDNSSRDNIDGEKYKPDHYLKESACLIVNQSDDSLGGNLPGENVNEDPTKEDENLSDDDLAELQLTEYLDENLLRDRVDPDDTLIELTSVKPVDVAGHLLEVSLGDSDNALTNESELDMITGHLHKCSSQESMDKPSNATTLLGLARGDNQEKADSDAEQTFLIPSFKLKDVQTGIEISDSAALAIEQLDGEAETTDPSTSAEATEPPGSAEATGPSDGAEAAGLSDISAEAAGVDGIFNEHSSDDEMEPKSEDVDGYVIVTGPTLAQEDNVIEQDSDTEDHLEVIAYQDTEEAEDIKVLVYDHPFVSHVNVESVKYPESCLAKEKKKKRKDSSLKDSEDHIKSLLVSLNLKHLKAFLRTSLWAHNHQMRGLLWQQACKYLHKAGGDFYEEMVDELYNQEGQSGEVTLPSLVDFDNMPTYHLNTSGIETVQKILAVMHHTNPDITYCPTLFGLVSVFLHYMTPSDAYNCAYGLLRSKETFIMQTKVSFEATKMVIRDLTKKYAKSAYVNLVRNTNNIDGVFDSWYWWIFRDLPFPHLVCIIDCFILEGIKVFYRAALAILILYTKHTAKRSRSSSRNTDAATSIRQFCRDFPFRTDKLLRTGFGIRGLTRKHIKKLQIKNEMYINSRHLHTSASSQSMNGRRRANSGPTNIHIEGSSTIFSQDMLYTVWSWLPPRFAVCQPELLYTSEEHGTSLMTLYTRVEDHQPTLIVIKTTNDEVFGAFCSTYWRDRKHRTKNLSYFGTGETFIFTLNPKKQKYSWVGLLQDDIPNTANMFLAGDNSMLTVGGGHGEAIQLDANLLHCRTEKCDTFLNEPLCSGQDFTCKVVEVYGFV